MKRIFKIKSLKTSLSKFVLKNKFGNTSFPIKKNLCKSFHSNLHHSQKIQNGDESLKNEAQGFFDKAVKFFEQGKTEEAREYLKKSSDLGDENAIFAYALVLQNLGKVEEAKVYLKKSIDLGNTDAFIKYADLLQNEENFKEAKEYYLKALNSGNEQAMKGYLNFCIGEIKACSTCRSVVYLMSFFIFDRIPSKT